MRLGGMGEEYSKKRIYEDREIGCVWERVGKIGLVGRGG